VLVIFVPLERKKPKGAFGWGDRGGDGGREGGGEKMWPHRKPENCQNFQLGDQMQNLWMRRVFAKSNPDRTILATKTLGCFTPLRTSRDHRPTIL
jgi:hypothetical protein